MPALHPRRRSLIGCSPRSTDARLVPAAARTLATLALLALLLVGAPLPAPAQDSVGQEPPEAAAVSRQNALDKLAGIQESIEAKRGAVRELKGQLKQLQDPAEIQEAEQKIARFKAEIANLQQSFEHIALGGIDLSDLSEAPDQRIHWRDEVEQISRPLLSTLKEITARPRQVDSLRRQLERQQNQLKVIDKALESLRLFGAQTLPPTTVEPLNQLLTDWEQRRVDLQRDIEITRFKLDSLITRAVPWHTSAREALVEFAQRRGLTLLLAVLVSLAIWLLFGIGAVREQERLVLDGIPFLVESLGVYSVLRNPALEGVVRLPLHNMNAFASRPFTEGPWLPCQPGDYIILADDSFGHVQRQSIEMVEVAVLDSRMRIGTKDFLAQNIRNLSRDGFGIAATFGVDYQHQAICLDTVPARFRQAILERFDLAGLRQDIHDILVEFSAAGASSLDYRIYLVLNGRAAPAYYKAQRLVQQACVDTCNREGWVIPFTQVTVHSAEVPAP